MKIGIIGYGVVGKATEAALKYEAGIFDPAQGHTTVRDYDVAFICVPTPLDDGGVLDTAYVERALADTEAELKVVRSTVPLGFMTEGVYMPAFLREAHPVEEQFPAFRVLGGEPRDCHKVLSLFSQTGMVFCVDYRDAEMAKLALNAHLAMQVSYATEMAEAAIKGGADWGIVGGILRSDMRIGPMAYLLPGPFGGKCLPKDTTTLATQTDSTLLHAVLEVNDGHHHTRQLQEVSPNATG